MRIKELHKTKDTSNVLGDSPISKDSEVTEEKFDEGLKSTSIPLEDDNVDRTENNINVINYEERGWDSSPDLNLSNPSSQFGELKSSMETATLFASIQGDCQENSCLGSGVFESNSDISGDNLITTSNTKEFSNKNYL